MRLFFRIASFRSLCGLQADYQRAMHESQVEGRKTRRLGPKIAVAEGPPAERAFEPIDPFSFPVEQTDALTDVGDSGKMRIEAPKIASDDVAHGPRAGRKRREAIRSMAARE
ncbi:hypothetical protein DSM21852_30310 [Methylocystis bryophila]|nr:hypothetical protein DSM21852_30310 [Methylocystis bryophila]